ncbi:MAG: tRNA (adenosine(37)-N6)-dimethylallyltransferase MiaA [Bacilli bacterium]|nr:tRNA (adenosine(37)-N6)-dimethylallyltransferase MiaA [Bacilli bacterium]
MIIVISGPTAVGKTKLSIELAKKYNAEIINYDSVQIYKDMDIASAKVTKEEMEGIPHHLLDIKNYDENYSIYDYQMDARKKIEELKNKNKNIIFVGGTGLYIKAALYDYRFNKEEEKYDFSNLTNEELYKRIIEIDKDIKVDKDNNRRLVRTLTNLLNGNITNNKDTLLYDDCYFIGLKTDRDILYERINKRVDIMLDNGLIDEAKKFYNKERTKAIMTPIGYKELFRYLDNEITKDEAIDLIKKNSRHYAKRQFTFFNNQMNIKWFDVNFNDFNNTVLEVENYINLN